MIVLKLKGKVSESRLKSVMDFLHSLKIEVEVTDSRAERPKGPSEELALHAGLWKDRDIDASDLRKKAWKSA